MAAASLEVAVGHRAEAGRPNLPAGKLGELVEVRLGHLDLRKARRRLVREAVLDHMAGQEERRRVHRHHAHAVEGHDPAQ
jgi:hypothetical protein